MNPFSRLFSNPRKILGYTFLSTAVLGTLFCLIAIAQVWRLQAAAATTADEAIAGLQAALHTTQDGLAVLDDLVQASADEVALLETTVQTATLTIEDTGTILQSLSDLTGTELPGMISATQTSLASAQTSAVLIDDMLSGLSAIPILGLGVYQPEVPLGAAIGDISESMDPLTPALLSMSDVLAGSAENIDALQGEFESIAGTTQEIAGAMEQAKAVVADYRSLAEELDGRLDDLKESAPGGIRGFAWLLTLVLVALLFAQLGLGERGFTILSDMGPSAKEEPTP